MVIFWGLFHLIKYDTRNNIYYVTVNCFWCLFLDAVSVEPTYSYYEKVSEELERIVLEVQEKEEVQPLSDGEKHCSESYLHVWLDNLECGITLGGFQEIGSASYLCDASQSCMIYMKKEFQVRRDFMQTVQQPAHVFSWLFLFFLRGSHQQDHCFDQGTGWCHRWKGGCYRCFICRNIHHEENVFICLWQSVFVNELTFAGKGKLKDALSDVI